MLRSVPDKNLGIIILISAILILFIFPFFISKKFILPFVKKWDLIAQNSMDNKFNKKKLSKLTILKWTLWRLRMRFLFWIFLCDFTLLGYIGSKPVEYPYDTIGLILTIIYFLHFILLILFFEVSVIEEDERWSNPRYIDRYEKNEEKKAVEHEPFWKSFFKRKKK